MSKLPAAYLIEMKRKHSTQQQIYDVWKSNTGLFSVDDYAQNSSEQSDKSFFIKVDIIQCKLPIGDFQSKIICEHT